METLIYHIEKNDLSHLKKRLLGIIITQLVYVKRSNVKSMLNPGKKHNSTRSGKSYHLFMTPKEVIKIAERNSNIYQDLIRRCHENKYVLVGELGEVLNFLYGTDSY